ncbi:MAG: glycosyl hydrolase family 28-related protein [Flavobacteriia bacterium]|jgi:hypothetical protein
MKSSLALLFITFILNVLSQTIPSDRVVNWSLAGVRDSSTSNFAVIDVVAGGLVNDGVTPCDAALTSLFSTHAEPAIFYFPAGTYLFNAPISLRSNCVFRGQGATVTNFIIDHSGSGNGININGTAILADSTSFSMGGIKNDTSILVLNGSNYASGDWIRIVQDDADLIFSSWAAGSVGQIVRIAAVNGNVLQLESPLRMDYSLTRHPRIHRILPKSNVGIECLSIERLDNTAPEQASVLSFNYAVNSWVNGIEISKTTFAHVEATACSNLAITNSYFHDAHEYGGGGRGYGVMLHFTTNECLVYSNIFSHLRHSMILQAGSNGNVFCYNFSRDPYWTGSIFLPSNSAGDMVLHGNYPYSNLFEQNDGQNMVIDNSHGANGPHNTYFRNRGGLFGIFFSDNTSPNQNLVGNEITNTGTPMSAINYTIQGTGHFVFGNNNKGTISPSGTSVLPDSSYYFTSRPALIPQNVYASIGTPNALNSGSIPATYFYQNSDFFANACEYTTDLSLVDQHLSQIKIFPNPLSRNEWLNIEGDYETLEILNLLGQVIYQCDAVNRLSLANYNAGIYRIKVTDKLNASSTFRILIVN